MVSSWKCKMLVVQNLPMFLMNLLLTVIVVAIVAQPGKLVTGRELPDTMLLLQLQQNMFSPDLAKL